ncbi:uncharacterized protein DNG_00194 [Cephalotrichum gorgonifer]|uniref:Uncharacterized protein n=1 Tax=Cephalotrichum gorgonifer TaxID=2041049 RepID=A0AAE8MNH0_9PEZI|nr:uncharacterized protein DNG_00194 [Cephalotrichum gorgonifer]
MELLMSKLKPDDMPIYDLLAASMSSGDTAALEKLVGKFATDKRNLVLFPTWVLHRAAILGNIDAVNALVDAGVLPDDVRFRGDETDPILSAAAAGGNSEIVRMMLDRHKFDVDAIVGGDVQFRALTYVCSVGFIPIVHMLLEARAKVNGLPSHSNSSPLIEASLYGRYDLIESLCQSGADPNLQDRGESKIPPKLPVLFAAVQGFHRSLRRLLDAGAEVEASGTTVTPLYLAINGGHLEVCRILVERGANLQQDGVGSNGVERAAYYGYTEIVDYFMSLGRGDEGAEPETINENSAYATKAFFRAVQTGLMSMVRCLLKWIIDVNGKDEDGYTAVYTAAWPNNADIVQLLLDTGACSDEPCYDWTPLQIAYDYEDVVRALLNVKDKPKIDEIGPHGPVLFLAARWNSPGVIRALLEHKPNPDAAFPSDRRNPGIGAVSAAILQGNTEVVELLLEAGANVDHQTENGNCPVHFAVLVEDAESSSKWLRILLRYHRNLELRDNQGNTALHYITAETSPLPIKMLVDAGASPNLTNKAGEAPLLRAVIIGNMAVARYLLTQKVRVDIPNLKGSTALHMACMNGSVEFVELLLEHHAEANAVGSSVFGTLLQAACARAAEDKKKDIISCLLQRGKARVNIEGGLLGTALNTAEHINFFAEHVDLFRRHDMLKRKALHFAVGSGRLEVVEKVFELGGYPLTTPTLTAGRPSCADLWVRGKGWNGSTWDEEAWSPLKVARYHGAPQSVLDLLTSRACGIEGCETSVANDENIREYHGQDKNAGSEPPMAGRTRRLSAVSMRSHYTRSARRRDKLFCSACLFELYGVYLKCSSCEEFPLCFKCSGSRRLIHRGHVFSTFLDEFEESAHITEASDSSDTDDSDSD